MGLFSEDKKIYVASSAFNLAGDEAERVNYLQTLVVRSVLSPSSPGIADTLEQGYLGGPGIKFRSFYRWAAVPAHYGEVGLMSGRLKGTVSINTAAVGAELDLVLGLGGDVATWVQQTDMGLADFTYWAEQWILEHRPADFGGAWTSDLNGTTGEITITFPDATTATFTPVNFDYAADYLYIYYNETSSGVSGPLLTGSTVALGGAAFPATDPADGWTLTASSATPQTTTLHTTVSSTTVKHYSDGRPDETSSSGPTTTTSTGSWSDLDKTWNRSVYLGRDPGSGELKRRQETEHQHETATVVSATSTDTTTSTDTLGGGVTVTTTTTTTTVTESLAVARSYRIDTQEFVLSDSGPTRLYIYKHGSGDAFFDGLQDDAGDYGQFFPFIPIRHNNQFLSDTLMPEVFAQTTKAYKKLTNGKLSELIDELAANEHLGDMDYIYVVPGVSLNVLDNSCRKYLYKFFENLQATQIGGPSFYAIWKAEQAAGNATFATWMTWFEAQAVPSDPLYGTPEPPRPSALSSLPVNKLVLANTGPADTAYRIELRWLFVSDDHGVGLAKPDAKPGELWFEKLTSDSVSADLFQLLLGFSATYTLDRVRLYWQRDAGSYTYLEMVGLTHVNSVYQGKSVVIRASAALDDEDESGFLVPLHYETLKAMSLVDSTQMTTACLFLVVNSYQIVKRHWWQKGFFRVLLSVIIAVIVTLATQNPLAGIQAGAGTFAVTQVIVQVIINVLIHAVINMLVATVLMAVLEKAAVALFGHKVGEIVALVAFVVINVLAPGGDFSQAISRLMQPQVLLQITNAVIGAYAAVVSGDTLEIQQQMLDYQKQAEEEASKIQQAYFKEFGYGEVKIDPLMFADSARIVHESVDTFLTRTLMTGSEIAEMAVELIRNFPQLSLQLPDAFSE